MTLVPPTSSYWRRLSPLRWTKPASVICVSARMSRLRLINPFRWTNPASVIAVFHSARASRSVRSLRCANPASVTALRLSHSDSEGWQTLEVRQSLVADSCLMKAQRPESSQSFKVGQSGVGDGRFPEFQSLNSFEMDDMVQFRPVGRPIRTDSYEIDSDDMADVIDAEAIREPSQPPGISIRIEVVFDVSVRPPDGRHGIALDMGLVDDPTEGAPDHQDQDDQPSHAEPRVAPPGASGWHCHHRLIVHKPSPQRPGRPNSASTPATETAATVITKQLQMGRESYRNS